MTSRAVEVTVTARQHLVSCLRNYGYPRTVFDGSRQDNRVTRYLARRGYSRPDLPGPILGDFGGLVLPVCNGYDVTPTYERVLELDLSDTPQGYPRLIERDPRSTACLLHGTSYHLHWRDTEVSEVAQIVFLSDVATATWWRSYWESLRKAGLIVENIFLNTFGVTVTEFGRWRKRYDVNSTLSSATDLLLCDETLHVYRLGRHYDEAFITKYSCLGDFLAMALVPIDKLDFQRSTAVVERIWCEDSIDEAPIMADRWRRLTYLLNL